LAKLGLSVRTLTSQLAQQYGLENEKGVLVVGVQGGSPASLAGLRPGDLIVEADRRSVTTVGELRDVLNESMENNQVLFLIKRKGGSLFVLLQTK
jgi:serine protease Do